MIEGRQKAIKVVAPAWSPGVPVNTSMIMPKKKAQHQELPFGSVEWQQHDENQVNIRMHIPAQADVVDDQHLEEHEHNKADDL